MHHTPHRPLLAGLSLGLEDEELCPTCLEGYSEENPKAHPGWLSLWDSTCWPCLALNGRGRPPWGGGQPSRAHGIQTRICTAMGQLLLLLLALLSPSFVGPVFLGLQAHALRASFLSLASAGPHSLRPCLPPPMHL